MRHQREAVRVALYEGRLPMRSAPLLCPNAPKMKTGKVVRTRRAAARGVRHGPLIGKAFRPDVTTSVRE